MLDRELSIKTFCLIGKDWKRHVRGICCYIYPFVANASFLYLLETSDCTKFLYIKIYWKNFFGFFVTQNGVKWPSRAAPKFSFVETWHDGFSKISATANGTNLPTIIFLLALYLPKARKIWKIVKNAARPKCFPKSSKVS